jgi:hypothetical protein
MLKRFLAMGHTELNIKAYHPSTFPKFGEPAHVEYLRAEVIKACTAIKVDKLELHGEAVVPALYCRKIPALATPTTQHKEFVSAAAGNAAEMRTDAEALQLSKKSGSTAAAANASAIIPPFPEFNAELVGKRIDACYKVPYKDRGVVKAMVRWCAGTITDIRPAVVNAKGKKTAPAFIVIMHDDGDEMLLAADRPTFWHVKKPGSWRWFSEAGKPTIDESAFVFEDSDDSDNGSIDDEDDFDTEHADIADNGGAPTGE